MKQQTQQPKEVLKKSDFTYSANAEGYMIQYRGQNIGGASILGKSKSRGKNRLNDIREYTQSALREIDNLCAGYGSKHLLDAIKKLQPTKEVLHTQPEYDITASAPIRFMNLHRASDLPGDEYAVNILDEENRLVAKAIFSPHFNYLQAEANAELIVKAVNGWNRLNEDKKFAESVKQALNTQIARLIQSNKELRRALHNCVVTLEALKEKYPDLLGDTTLKEGKTALNNTK